MIFASITNHLLPRHIMCVSLKATGYVSPYGLLNSIRGYNISILLLLLEQVMKLVGVSQIGKSRNNLHVLQTFILSQTLKQPNLRNTSQTGIIR
jgi:hypothetical protein